MRAILMLAAQQLQQIIEGNQEEHETYDSEPEVYEYCI